MNDPLQPDLVHTWLIRSRSDLNLGWAALNTAGVLPEDACFHAQQCAEKALKGYLTLLHITFPRTHVVEMLLDLLKSHGVEVPPNVDEAYELSQYAVQTRYPGEWEPIDESEARQALKQASLVLEWVQSNLENHSFE